MILTMLRLQKKTETDFQTWHFQGVGVQGSHYALRSVVLYAEPQQDLVEFSAACDFLFNEASMIDSFAFVEAQLRSEDGAKWHICRDADSYDIRKNEGKVSLIDFQEAILQSVVHPSAVKNSRKIMGAWQISKKLLVGNHSSFEEEQEDTLAAMLRKKEHDLITQLQSLIGQRFVVNRGNLLDLYDQIDQYLNYKQVYSSQLHEIEAKLKEVGRYGVRRFELLKNESILLERMQEQITHLDRNEDSSTHLQILEKIIFFWNRQHGVSNFVRTPTALVSFAKKLVHENINKVETLQRVQGFRDHYKEIVQDQERCQEALRYLDANLKKYFSQQRIELSFFNQNTWQQFYQLMDCWLLMDSIAESTGEHIGRHHDLFMCQQMECPLAVYRLPPEQNGKDAENFLAKLRTANQTIFRIFLTDNQGFYQALVRAGMGWAQTT